MTIFENLGDFFLRVVLTDKEYNHFVKQEGPQPEPIRINMKAAMDICKQKQMYKHCIKAVCKNSLN